MFLVFYIFRLLLLPLGVRIFGTNLHRCEKFGLWRQRHRQHMLWKKGTYQKSFLGGKLRAFCGLHLIAKWSCFICYLRFVLSNVHTLFLSFFLKKSCLDLKSGAVMAQWQETVTWRRWKRFKYHWITSFFIPTLLWNVTYIERFQSEEDRLSKVSQ